MKAHQLLASGTVLWLAALNPNVIRGLERASLSQTLVGHDPNFFGLEQAVEAYLARQRSAEGFR